MHSPHLHRFKCVNMIEDFSTLIHACSVHWRFWAHVRCTLGSQVASFLGRTRPITPTSGLEELEKRRTWDWRRGESGKVISCDGNINICKRFGMQFWKFNRSWKRRVLCAVSLLFAPSRIPPELQTGGLQMQKYIEKDGIGRYSVVFKSAPMRGLAPSTRRRG